MVLRSHLYLYLAIPFPISTFETADRFIRNWMQTVYKSADNSLARPDLKKQLKGCHFSSDAEVIAAAETWLDGQNSELFLSGLQKLEFGRCSFSFQVGLRPQQHAGSVANTESGYLSQCSDQDTGCTTEEQLFDSQQGLEIPLLLLHLHSDSETHPESYSVGRTDCFSGG